MIRSSNVFSCVVRIALAGLLLSLQACNQTEEGIAGIDGSGNKPDEIANGFSSSSLSFSSSSSSSIAPPPPASSSSQPPVSEPVKIFAQGTINGFGSVIVHGDRYDTGNAQFFRNGEPTSEGDFEVGDMVAIFGLKEDGDLIATEVHYQSSMSGIVESYDYGAGVILMLGQRIHIDVGTVISDDLNVRHLLGKSISVSGWLDDSEWVATRITQNSPDQHKSVISGFVHHVRVKSEIFQVGDIEIIWPELTSDSLKVGDLVRVEGQIKSRATDTGTPRDRFLANKVHVLDVAQSAHVESMVLSGIVRNVARGDYITLNNFVVTLTENTTVEGGTLNSVGSDDHVTVRAQRDGDLIIAEHITVDSQAAVVAVAGGLTQLDTASTQQTLFVGGLWIGVEPQTAVVDLTQKHSRLNIEQLAVGDYLVVETVLLPDGNAIARTIKRTKQGTNDRLFSPGDKPAYEWYFTPEPVNPADPYENVLGADRFASVDVENKQIITASGLRLTLRNSKNYDQDGERYNIQETLELLAAEQTSGRLIWLNYQVDSREDNIWLDQLHILFDFEGELVEFPVPEAQKDEAKQP